MTMTVTLPDELAALLEEPESPGEEVRVRLAAHLYAVGRIGVAGAARLAGMSETWLVPHGIMIPWTEADLATERRWLAERVGAGSVQGNPKPRWSPIGGIRFRRDEDGARRRFLTF